MDLSEFDRDDGPTKVQQIESPVDSLRCTECHKAFTKKRSLTRHLLQVHDKGRTAKPVFACKHCKKTFDRKSHLKRHQEKSKCVVMRASLADLKPEEVRVFREQAKKGYAGRCVFCGQDRDKLKDHVWRKHPQEMQ